MIDNKRILVVVPARGGSKGIKLKNIMPVNGVPLVALVGEIVKQLPYVDRAIVSTDHPMIAEVAKEAGLDVPFFRPEELSGDFISDVQVLTHALLSMEKMDATTYDLVVMLQPTSPLRQADHVTETVMKLL
ncbi:MAG: acylneuraminate cytidylyltransferase family protein, partial [Bacillota bacterium]